MKYHKIYLLALCSLWTTHSFGTSVSQWDGDFKIEELGETLIDGSRVSMDYFFKIDSQKNYAHLSMVTWHALIPCEGDYTLSVKDNILQLHYAGEAKETGCVYPAPQFEVTKKREKYYIRGPLFSYAPKGKWLQLEKYTPAKPRPDDRAGRGEVDDTY